MNKTDYGHLNLVYDLICIDLEFEVAEYYKFPYEFMWLVFGPKINIEQDFIPAYYSIQQAAVKLQPKEK